MSAGTLSLLITTPLSVIIEAHDIASFRADDESGSFGIMPGHVDFLTAAASTVARWRTADGPWKYCAVHGAVLTVSGGNDIHIACRQAVPGTELEQLEAEVKRRREADLQAAASARVAQARLHARAIRQIMSRLGSHAGLGEDAGFPAEGEL